jgi:arylsulfatase A
VVIVSSDNGAPAGEEHGYSFFRSNGNLRASKGQLYEGGIRAPLLARWPGRINPGSTSSLPVYFADFLPTAAEIAGARPPSGIDGVSILPELTGSGKQHRHEYLYWESPGFDAKKNEISPTRLAQAVRMGDWKALRLKPGAPLELYNLRQDPAETTNVAAQNPQVVASIEAILKTARTAPRPHNTGSMKFVT